MSGAVAVLDVGKTNVKLALFARDGAALWERSEPNLPLPAPPYLHTDIEAIWAFFLSSLAEATKRCVIEAIVTTAHGAAAVLVNERGLALPMIDYEEPGVEAIEREYAKIRPPFERTLSPPLPQRRQRRTATRLAESRFSGRVRPRHTRVVLRAVLGLAHDRRRRQRVYVGRVPHRSLGAQ